MKIRVLFILFFAGFLQLAFSDGTQNNEYTSLKIVDYPVFTKGEKLQYLAHYGILNAGIATVEISNGIHYVNGKKSTKVVGKGYSTGTFDFFFKVRDSYITYMNAETLEPYRFVRHVDEGGFVFDQEYNFNHANQTVTTEKKDTVNVPLGIQDLVSAYYYARSIDLNHYKVGDVLTFKAFVDGKVEPIRIKYIGKETVKIKSGKYRCFKFQPIVQSGRVFNDPNDLVVYISDDKNRIPVLVEAKVIVGSVKLELMTTERLLHPLAKL
tara:strand:+ start:31172 stop:31972 length:801 start_codon:yes stop_codon:yes gene_type:complete